MAEIQYGAVGGDTPALSSANLKWIVNWLGGLISVTLIAGLVFWGYQLMVRDVSGIPVVRALEGPMRVTPVDPGGASAEYQGLAVNNIAAVGEAEAPADRLVLAPKPTAVGGGDPTAAQLEEMAAAQVAQGAEEVATVVPEVAVAPVAQDQASLIEATLRQVEDEHAAPAAAVPGAPVVEVVARSIAGVSSSLYPMVRPASLVRSVRAAAVSEPGASGVKTVSPADIPAGTRLAQLGAFESVDIAEAEWLKIVQKFDVFMADKSRVIEQAQSGGKVFYRLRAHGFEDLSDARRFCSTLLAAQANCIPVVTR